MKKNKHPLTRSADKLQDINNEANKLFAEKVMMPMIMFAATIMFVAIILDYGFQLIEAIDILVAN